MDMVKLRNLNHAVYLLTTEQDLQVAVRYYKAEYPLGKWIDVGVELEGNWFSWAADTNERLDQITSMLLCLFNSLTWGRENG